MKLLVVVVRQRDEAAVLKRKRMKKAEKEAEILERAKRSSVTVLRAPQSSLRTLSTQLWKNFAYWRPPPLLLSLPQRSREHQVALLLPVLLTVPSLHGAILSQRA